MFEQTPDAKTAKGLARPYAKAAFDVAQTHDTIAGWEERLGVMADVIKGPSGAQLVKNPALDAEKTKAVLATVADKLGMTSPEKEFINLLVDNKRLSLLPWIHEAFVEARKLAAGITDVRIISAIELTPEQAKTLTEGLEKKFNIKAAPKLEVDPELIGGVKVVIGDMVYDGSIKGKLEALRKHLDNPNGP